MNQFKSVGVVSLLLTFFLASAVGQAAPPCVPANCTLPSCRCSNADTPGNLASNQIPQLVFLSFDEAVNVDNFALYGQLLSNRKNPNGEPVTATFFVTHDYTNYSMIHELWRNGHEIGLHSISANTSQQYWKNLTAAQWRQELVDQREQINVFGKVPPVEVKGVRGPQLIVGGDELYSVLNAARIQYDCSRPTNNSALWPYTNDYESIQKPCVIEPCPIGSHPGFWTVPIVNLKGQDGSECSLADQCEPVPRNESDTFDLLNNNFQEIYKGPRTPFGLYIRHGWINGTAGDDDDQIKERRLGYERFLDSLSKLNDVYIVSIARGIQWVQDPTPLANITNFAPFKVTVRPTQCRTTYSCWYRAGQTPFKPPLAQERMFHSCVPCPVAYPWVGNHLGRNPYQ